MSINNYPPPHKSAFKGLQWDYDAVLALSDEECCYSLSQREINILLATIDPISWKTRWFSYSDTLIDLDNLVKWQGNLARKLMSGCCNDTQILHRVTSTGGMEISTDGGATWIPDPADPRVTGTQLPNTIPGEGNDKKCNAATNALGNIQDAQAAFGASLSTATTIIGLALAFAGEIILLLLSAGTTAEILVPLLISTATALFGIAESTYNAEFTTELWDTVTCDLYCTVGDDGQWTTGQLNDLLALLDTDLTGNVALTLHSIISGWGTVGLNNAAISGGSSEADCSDCGCNTWCKTFDFTTGELGWSSFAQCTTLSSQSSAGWTGQCNSCGYFDTSIEITFTGKVTGISFDSYLDAGSLTPDIAIVRNSTPLLTGSGSVGVSTHHIEGLWTGSNHIQVFANSQCETFTRILSVTLRGIGANPFGDSNCE